MDKLKQSFLLHFLADIFYFVYIIFFPKKYDIFIVLIFFAQCLHWIFLKNECSLSYYEKKLINPEYKLGENIKYVPHEDYLYNRNKPFIISMHLFRVMVFIFIMCRNLDNNLIVGISMFNLVICINLIKLRYFI